YVIYEAAFALCLLVLASRRWSIRLHAARPYPRWTAIAVGASIAIAVCLIAVIVLTGGFTVQAGSTLITARDTFNPLQALWLLIIVALWMYSRPRLGAEPDAPAARRALLGFAVVAVVSAIIAAPLVWRAMQL